MTAAADRTDPEYLESIFQYSFSRHGEKDFEKLKSDEQESIKETLGSFTKKTWHAVVQLPREKGLTPERKEKSRQSTYNKVLNRASSNHRGHNLYPFHMRVPLISKKCRLFGYQCKDTFYITHIDKNHSEHR
ncbi:MAG: hypothetical protein OYG31_02250 [Candidatus Kaiserbacteria bacterium]|nr:hypothetical protein [Candidatus Kaiserbacteria bacterium]